MRPLLDFEMNTAISIPRVRSARLPARLVSTRTGLYFEWGLNARAKLQESAAVILSEEAAWNLKAALLRSGWQPPPSIRIPEILEHTALDCTIESTSLRDIQRAWTAALRRRFG